MKIHREGFKTLTYCAIVGILLNTGAFVFLPGTILFFGLTSIVLFLFFLNFFRNPSRTTVLNVNQIIAPADGKVVVIEETLEPEFLKDKRIQISVFMSPINVHVNRNPVSGKIRFFKYHPGKYLMAWHPKSSSENERTTIVIELQSGIHILMRQVAGFLARRIVWYVKENDEVQQGQDMGFIKFGSRVDVFLPLGTKINVQLEQMVTGGETVLAELE